MRGIKWTIQNATKHSWWAWWAIYWPFLTPPKGVALFYLNIKTCLEWDFNKTWQLPTLAQIEFLLGMLQLECKLIGCVLLVWMLLWTNDPPQRLIPRQVSLSHLPFSHIPRCAWNYLEFFEGKNEDEFKVGGCYFKIYPETQDPRGLTAHLTNVL